MKKTVGIVGCGAIGSALARGLERDCQDAAKIVALVDVDQRAARILQQRLASHPPIVTLQELIRRSSIVVEAAEASAAPRVARLALAAGRDVLIMSTGGLLTSSEWQRVAKRSRGRLHIPSGALAGIDGVKAMAGGTIRRLLLTTRKPPQALASAPFVRAHRLQLNRLRRPKVLFEGSPAEVVRAFPQNTNVAATAMLAASSVRGRRPLMTVRVVADPTIRTNRHELEVEGKQGRMRCAIESRPSAANPKTSQVAIDSALVTLKQLFNPIRVGT
ncbi:MAG: DUF108 domain-containing protein [Candidatus Omnitrophica bacterium]|nr:DUF108 domain-containing protein [Candidatus Omnitrophota bacterium]